jgi:hypothetical protein
MSQKKNPPGCLRSRKRSGQPLRRSSTTRCCTCTKFARFRKSGLRNDRWADPVTEPFFSTAHPAIRGSLGSESISQLIVAIDETLDAKEQLTTQSVDAVMSHSVFLLLPAENGGEFGERYVSPLCNATRAWCWRTRRSAKRIGSGEARLKLKID